MRVIDTAVTIAALAAALGAAPLTARTPPALAAPAVQQDTSSHLPKGKTVAKKTGKEVKRAGQHTYKATKKAGKQVEAETHRTGNHIEAETHRTGKHIEAESKRDAKRVGITKDSTRH